MRSSRLNKVIRKVRKTQHRNPLFGHIGDEISKNRKKKYTGLERGMKLSLAAKLVLNWVCPVLSFPERLQPITAAAMCTVTVNVLEPGAFNPEFQYFIPSFNKISWLRWQQPGGDEASNEGTTQAQQVMTLGITPMGEQLIVLESGQDIADSRSQGGPKLCWPVLPF